MGLRDFDEYNLYYSKIIFDPNKLLRLRRLTVLLLSNIYTIINFHKLLFMEFMRENNLHKVGNCWKSLTILDKIIDLMLIDYI